MVSFFFFSKCVFIQIPPHLFWLLESESCLHANLIRTGLQCLTRATCCIIDGKSSRWEPRKDRLGKMEWVFTLSKHNPRHSPDTWSNRLQKEELGLHSACQHGARMSVHHCTLNKVSAWKCPTQTHTELTPALLVSICYSRAREGLHVGLGSGS